MNKTFHYKKIIPWFLSFFWLLPFVKVLAQSQTYVPLQPNAFPGVTENTTNLGLFLGSVFNWGIALAVVLALIMIIYGGIEMMTTDSWEKHTAGQERIWGALKGLGLALVSWLLIYVINPNLVLLNGNLILSPK